MNADLYLWDAELGRPASFDDACRQLQTLEVQQPGPSAGFLAFAQALQQPPRIGTDPAWAPDQLADAQQRPAAVWALALPPGDLLRTLKAVIERATAAGLVVLSEPLGMAFLPGGDVLPPEKKGQWLAMANRLGTTADDEGPDARAAVTGGMQRLLNPHGFTSGAVSTSFDATFERPYANGLQQVRVQMQTVHGYDRCTVTCTHTDREVDAVFEEVFGTGPFLPETFWFIPTAFVDEPWGVVPVENAAQIQGLVDTVERHGLPVLDLARRPGGLDRVMNEPSLFPFTYPGLNPRSPQNLADHFVNYGKLPCLKPLIAAHLAGNPNFNARVGYLRSFVQGRADINEEQLMRLVNHLRARTR